MKTTLSVYDFRDAFIRAGRKEQFSYEALGMLYDYFEEVDPDYDLDVVGICCEFAEQSPDDIAWDYGIDTSMCDDETEVLQVVRQYLQDETTVIGTTEAGKIVYIQY
jgi:hypothetical protein